MAAKIEEIAHRVTESEGMELVEVEVKGGGAHRFVRISIDKPTGVTHGDCEAISQQVGTILDVEDVVPGGQYTLEAPARGKLFFFGHLKTLVLSAGIRNRRQKNGAT